MTGLLSLLLDNVGHFLVMIVLLAISAFCSGSETALFSLPRDRLRRFRQSTNPFERVVPNLLDHPRSLLVTILFINMLVNVTFFALASGIVWDIEQRGYGAVWSAAAGLLALLTVVLLGEVTPKTIAATSPVAVAKVTGLPIWILRWLLAPLRYFLDRGLIEPLSRLVTGRKGYHGHSLFLTAEELQAIVELASKESVVARDEGEMISEVLEIHNTKVREVMVPRVDIAGCDLDMPTPELLKLLRRTKKKRVVVYRGSPDAISGIVRARQAFLHPEKTVAELVEPVHFVPEQQTVEGLLRLFRAKKIKIAIVVDEYGGTAGLVTLEDCIEEIIGDIRDEYDQPEVPFERVSDTEFILDGNLSMRAWSEYLETELDTEMGVSTLGGFVTGLLGHMPQAGDTCRYGNVRFTVEEVTCRLPRGAPCGRASKIRVEILHPESKVGQRKSGQQKRRPSAESSGEGPGHA
jgi:putative hemolysin